MPSDATTGAHLPAQATLYRAFIGPNDGAYLGYFTRRDAGGSWLSWHWPSTVAVFYWALYRKQWMYAVAFALTGMFGLLACGFHAAALANASEEQVTTFTRFWLGVAVAAFLVPPLITMPLYYRAARAAIARTAPADAAGDRVAAVARRGGVSRAGLWLGVLFTCLLPVGLAWLGRDG